MNPRDRMAYKGRASPERSWRRSCATETRPTALSRAEHRNSRMPFPASSNPNSDPAPAPAPMQVLRGIAVSPGIAIGPVLVLDSRGVRLPPRRIAPGAVAAELARLDAGLDAAIEEAAQAEQ